MNYFLVSVNIIKNGKDIITEEHGIKGKENTPEHGFNSLRQKIKDNRKKSYPKDTHETVIVYTERITKEQFEDKFGFN